MSHSNNDRETSMDANVLMAELDKGLRSPIRGEQCEAIVRFPWLFKRYPFPILVNSACLKLAEVFRNGSNFCRLLILRAMQESENHLDKISSSDEFIRSIFAVSYSNDPVARAVTLQVLATISSIASDRKDIHHYIRESLDSNDEFEVSAAIEAAASFSQKSVEFAHNIYPKVLSQIKSLSTPVETKIQLMTILHHPHYDSDLAICVRSECESLLMVHPSQKFMQVTLNTMTYICSASLTCIPQQVNLLLQYFNFDERIGLRRCAVKDLHLLASSSPHLWSQMNMNQLLSGINNLEGKVLQKKEGELQNLFIMLLEVLSQLFRCPSILQGDVSRIEKVNSQVANICLEVVRGDLSPKLSAVCFQILTSICLADSTCQQKLQMTVTAFQNYFYTKMFAVPQRNSSSEHLICRNVVQLCSAIPDVKEQITSCLRLIILSKDVNEFWIGIFAETLCALESKEQPESFYKELVELIEAEIISDENVLVKVFTLAFQTCLISGLRCDPELATYIGQMNLWCVYRIVRQAMRFGHFEFAKVLIDELKKKASSEFVFFWMSTLRKMCDAEAFISDSSSPMSKRLTAAIESYVECITAIKGAVSSSHPLKFSLEYLNLRLKTLEAHENFRLSCNLVRTAPASAIAAAIATTSRDDLLRFGMVVTQMRKCAKEFRQLSENYSTLFQSSFNADHQTLAHIQLLQSSCTMIAEAIESIFQINRVSSLFVDQNTHLENSRLDGDKESSCEHQQMVQVCHRISSVVRNELGAGSSQLTAGQIELLSSIGEEVLSVSLRVPRLFFQSVQMMSVTLNVSPQPKLPGESIVLPPHNSLALKVEGVIVSNQIRAARKVTRVSLTVSSSPILKNGEFVQFGKAGDLNMNCLVTPHKDYFQSQFLLSFPAPGLHSVTVEAAIIDQNDAQWKTGPTITFNVKLQEEQIMSR